MKQSFLGFIKNLRITNFTNFFETLIFNLLLEVHHRLIKKKFSNKTLGQII